MGLHNLESESLIEIVSDHMDEHERSQMHSWIDGLLSQYGSNPAAPFSTEAELAAHLLTFIRGMYAKLFHRQAVRKAQLLQKVVEKNSSQRLSIFIEFVDCKTFEEAMERYTVWKGTLFTTRIDDVVVCWHPDKDYKPVDALQIHRTGYSELGRKKRRKMTRPEN